MMVKGHSSFSRTPELQLHHRLQLASCPQVKQLMSPMNFCTNDSHMLSDNIAVVLLIYFSCYCIVTKVKNIRQWGNTLHQPRHNTRLLTLHYCMIQREVIVCNVEKAFAHKKQPNDLCKEDVHDIAWAAWHWTECFWLNNCTSTPNKHL